MIATAIVNNAPSVMRDAVTVLADSVGIIRLVPKT